MRELPVTRYGPHKRCLVRVGRGDIASHVRPGYGQPGAVTVPELLWELLHRGSSERHAASTAPAAPAPSTHDGIIAPKFSPSHAVQVCWWDYNREVAAVESKVGGGAQRRRVSPVSTLDNTGTAQKDVVVHLVDYIDPIRAWYAEFGGYILDPSEVSFGHPGSEKLV